MIERRAVLFDVDGVLVHSLFHPDPARRRRWDQHLLADLGIEPDTFRSFFDDRFIDIVHGRASLVPALDAFLPTIGYRGSSLAFLSYWLTRDTELNLGLLDLVRRLRGTDADLFVATNQEHVRAFHLWSTVGLMHYFDDMFYAARFGADKSDPAFYVHVNVLIGPRRLRPLFFDDSRKVVDAATRAGWEAVLFEDLADCAHHPWIVQQLTK